MNYIFLYGLAIGLLILSAAKDEQKTKKALKKSLKALENILPQFLTVLLIVAAVLAVFHPDLISRFIGERSGFLGALGAAVVGAITLIPGFAAFPPAAGPLYGSFPVAAMLMKKGAGFFPLMVFIRAWSTTKIPMFLFEMNSLGYRFALSRMGINIVGILIISAMINGVVSRGEKERLYLKARRGV